jgi:hypothetical protein
MLLAALRRFGVLLVATAAFTAVVSLVIGLEAGASVSRSVSLGFYLVGAFLLIAGFFAGNRGPVRLKDDVGVPLFGARFVRWATPAEREETINLSAIFVTIGFVLILFGVAADTRHSLY